MAVSKEVVTYGLILVGSAISQLIAAPMIYGSFRVYIGYVGMGWASIGALIIALGFFWKWGPWERPLGISLLVVSFVFAGLVSLVLGGWLFTPLFILSLVFFVVAWAVLAGKKWGKTAMEIIVIIGFFVSLAGINNDGVVYVPGVLSAVYTFWYLGRPHVTEYFGVGQRKVELGERSFLLVLLFALLMLMFMAFLYVNPPSRIVGRMVSGGSGGVSGSDCVFHTGDVLSYDFEVAEGSSPVVFSIQSDAQGLTIAEKQGSSGSGLARVPFTDQYWVYSEPLDTFSTMHFEIIVKLFSIRTHIPQWVLLDLYLIVALFSIKFIRLPTTWKSR